mmetsp:Transcript_21364/g.63712  ORF Transcript_21364/g.63712 Transcript_21364/m.63712 type:complete len:460 (+) Transcript_21364:86-1465(+)
MAQAADGSSAPQPAGVLRHGSEVHRPCPGHVRWDEEVLAEHDKERGTRQKIDEPDTPFVRSPTASDSEGGESPAPHASEQDEKPVARDLLEALHLSAPLAADGGGAVASSSAATAPADVCPEALASRLDLFIRTGNEPRRKGSWGSHDSAGNDYGADIEFSRNDSGCSSRSSSSLPTRRPPEDSLPDSGRRQMDRHITLPDEPIAHEKPVSDSFKAMRAKHYNEVGAMKAFKTKGRQGACESSTESSGSEAEEACSEIQTNTNTNINQTISYAVDTPQRIGKRGGSSSDAAPPASSSGDAPAARAEATPEVRHPAFSAESDGGESGEGFKGHRHDHYANEWKSDKLTSDVNSLETNTNTNRNAGHGKEVARGDQASRSDADASRPPPRFSDGDSSVTSPTRASGDFKALRNAHYNEAAMMRQFKLEHPDSEGEDSDEQEDGGEVANGSAKAVPATSCAA